jgi:hypothetical protein
MMEYLVFAFGLAFFIVGVYQVRHAQDVLVESKKVLQEALRIHNTQGGYQTLWSNDPVKVVVKDITTSETVKGGD